MKKLVQFVFNKFGYSVTKSGSNKSNPVNRDITDKEFRELYSFCKPYTMTSVERMYALYLSVKYILVNDIKGDFIECGVWRGGSAMLIAKLLNNYKAKNRTLFLFDTFEGMSAPTDEDKDFKGVTASSLLQQSPNIKEDSIWCYSSYEEVQENMKQVGFESIQLIKGKVEETINEVKPFDKIALLRLDTDWYDSTLHELNHLYPLLNLGGVLIIDDYGHWEGCRKAVDEYFDKEKIKMLLTRIDYTGRIGIKN